SLSLPSISPSLNAPEDNLVTDTPHGSMATMVQPGSPNTTADLPKVNDDITEEPFNSNSTNARSEQIHATSYHHEEIDFLGLAESLELAYSNQAVSNWNDLRNASVAIRRLMQSMAHLVTSNLALLPQ